MGDLFRGIIQIELARNRVGLTGEDTTSVLITVVLHYAIATAVLCSFCLGMSFMRLRPIALRQGSGGGEKLTAKGERRSLLTRPNRTIGNNPMVWKEVWVDSQARSKLRQRILTTILVLVGFSPVAIIYYNHYFNENNSYIYGNSKAFQYHMGEYVKATTTAVAILTFLAAAFRAAGSLSGERDKQTLDTLLTTSLTARQILSGKLLGCMVNNRLLLFWLAGSWLLGVISGALQPLMVFPLAGVWALYAAVFSAVGLWFSLTAGTTLKATIYTMSATIFMLGGFWVVFGLCCAMPLAFLASRGPDWEDFLTFFAGLTPPIHFVWLTMREFSVQEFHLLSRDSSYPCFALLGPACWAGFGWFVYEKLVARFCSLYNRIDEHSAERAYTHQNGRSNQPTEAG